jgi:hypothetical protein
MDLLGIEAYPALVSSSDRQAVNNAQPSPGVFDHVIVMLVIDDNEYWLDPTITRQVGDLEYRYITNFGYAMVLGNSNDGLKPVVPKGYKSKIEMVEHFKGGKANKGMELVVNTSYFGPISDYKKGVFSERNKEKKTLSFANYYEELYTSVDVVERIGIDKSHTQPRLDLSEHYNLSNPWKDNEYNYFLKTNADIVETYLTDVVDKTRESPLYIGHPKVVRYKAIVTLDSGEITKVNDLNEEVIVRDKAFSYKREVKRNGDQLIIDHSYTTKSDFVVVEDIPKFSEHLKKVRDNLIYWIEIDKPEAIKMEDRMGKIKALLRKE